MLRSVLAGILVFLLGNRMKTSIVTNEFDEEYDFIIVGAGTSGSALAARLAENPNLKILLLEAGKSDYYYPSSTVPHAEPLMGTEADWNYKTVPQKHAVQENIGKIDKWPRGKVLGGTSTMNYMIYNRGSPRDFDSWVDHGAEGWGWENVEPYFKKAEKANGNKASKRLGRNGALNIEKVYETTLNGILDEAAKEIGINKTDYIDRMEGISRAYVTIKDGIRENSVSAYLRRSFHKRKNAFHIVVEALVSKIIMCNKQGSQFMPKACGVSFLKNGKQLSAWARKEVILSAGVVGTPQLLMLSGIGPREHLLDHNISVVVDLPGVGSNLQDHVRMTHLFFAEKLPQQAVVTNKEIKKGMKKYLDRGRGPLTAGAGVACEVHLRTKYSGTNVSKSTRERPFPDIQLLLTNLQSEFDYSQSSSSSSHSELTKKKDFYPGMKDAMRNRNGVISNFVIVAGLLHPKSRGNIRLKSNDFTEYPLIDPQYLANEDDIKVFIEGLKVVERLQGSETLQKLGIKLVMQPYCNQSENNNLPRSEEYYRCWLRSSAASEHHQCCTAKIGSRHDKFAVVDNRLRVHGIAGLRVVDASVMPHLTSGNTQAPCYMIAEKAADMIKEDWGLKESR